MSWTPCIVFPSHDPGGGGGNMGFGGPQTGSNVTVNVAGFVSGSSKDLGVELGNTIQGVQDTGLSTETV